MTRRIRIIGVGPGDPDLVTLQAVEAIRSVDFFVVTDRSQTPRRGMPDPLVNARDRLLDRHLERPARVVKLHEADVEAYLAVLAEHEGDAGVLVWGDPAFYDSTVSVVGAVAEHLDVEVDVVPGISSVSLLAARHGLVLQGPGAPLHLTTARDVLDAVASGQENLVVLLNRVIDLPGLEDWSIWWGGNLGTPYEELVAGRVGKVLPEIEAARERLSLAAGWVMDIYHLRR